MATFATFLTNAGLSTISSGKNTLRITDSSDLTCNAAQAVLQTRCLWSLKAIVPFSAQVKVQVSTF